MEVEGGLKFETEEVSGLWWIKTMKCWRKRGEKWDKKERSFVGTESSD